MLQTHQSKFFWKFLDVLIENEDLEYQIQAQQVDWFQTMTIS